MDPGARPYCALKVVNGTLYSTLFFNWEPMQSSQNRGDVVWVLAFCDNLCCIVLYPLKLVHQIFGNTIKEGIYIIDLR